MDTAVCLTLLSILLGPVLALPVQILFPPADKLESRRLETHKSFNKTNKDIQEPDLLIHGDIAVKVGRSAIKQENYLWVKTNGIAYVPYTFSSVYSQDEINLMTSAMKDYEALTCVTFIPRTNENNYLNIQSLSGCWSYIGNFGGAQPLSLMQNGCVYYTSIQHELDHALGFYHEHSRSDRDNYVKIMYQYIPQDLVSNFDIADTNNLGLEYDYTSVMHYPPNAFSNTSGQNTIVPIPDPSVPIGQGYGLTNLDVSKINKLYKCGLCSTLLSGVSGTLVSANYPSAYPSNSSCVWLIRSPNDKMQVSLQFNAFDVQSTLNCKSDYIRVYDGTSKSSPLILDRTCGTGLPPVLVASTNRMLVEFVSDDSVAGVGFKASYTTVKCGGTFYTTSRNVTSSNYPKAYNPNQDCLYLITAPTSYKVALKINYFFLEFGSSCQYDYLTIRNGDSESAPYMGVSEKYCGYRFFDTLVSDGNSMLLKFHSDYSGQATGFSASYTYVPSS